LAVRAVDFASVERRAARPAAFRGDFLLADRPAGFFGAAFRAAARLAVFLFEVFPARRVDFFARFLLAMLASDAWGGSDGHAHAGVG
jgi:hypothetical protein